MNCISTSVCTTLCGSYLNFSRLFDHSLSISPCELYLNADIAHDNLNEEACVELSSNMNYTIICPICIQDIFYEIPNSAFVNVEDCSNTGMHAPSYLKCYKIIKFCILTHTCEYTIHKYIHTTYSRYIHTCINTYAHTYM